MIDLNAIDRKLKAESAKAAAGTKKTGNAAFDSEMRKINVLEDAFNIFNDASQSLKEHYGLLEKRVSELDRDLADKSVALEENLKKSSKLERYQASILRCLPSAVIVFDSEGLVTSFNRRAEEITGLHSRDAIGKSISDVIGRESLPKRSSSGSVEGEISYSNSRGETLQLKTMHSFLVDDLGHTEGEILILHDITREKMLEENLARGKRLAAMGEMAAKLAHEIRNPLGGIELFASNLKKQLLDNPRGTGMADNICSAVASLNHLVTNTLQFARMKSPDLKPVDISEAMDESLLLALHLIDRFGVEIRKDYSSSLGDVSCDKEMMKQVFLNLIMNAVQAVGEGGRLEIALGCSAGGDVNISIKDNGPGMPDAVSSKVFEPFYSTKESGSGLGLAIVYNIVSAHKGTVKIESKEGQGTSVIVSLPGGYQRQIG